MRLTSSTFAACAALLLFGWVMPADAQKAYFLTGNNLLDTCEESDGACLGYVMGVADRISSEQALPKAKQVICVPVEATGKQVKDVVVKYLRSQPEQRHLPAPALVWNALQKSFPCSKK